MKKRVVQKKYRVFMIVFMIAISFIAVLTWNNTIKAAYQTVTDAGSSSFPKNGYYTYLKVSGPYGTSTITIRVRQKDNTVYKNYAFHDKSRTLTIEQMKVSDPNPYNLRLASTEVSTTQSDSGNYSWIAVKVKYDIHAHEEYNKVTYDTPSSKSHKLTNTPGHSKSARNDYVTTIGLSAYDTGVAPYRKPSDQKYYRYHACTVTINLKKAEYKVYYDGNGGSVSESERPFNDGDNFTFPTAWRKGYTFSKWVDKATGKVSNTGWIVCSGNYTEIAQWTANQYTIHYDANGGTGSMNDSTVTYNTKFTFPKSTFSNSGYSFLGWSKAKGSDVADYDDQEEITYKTDSDQTLYAVWGNGQYKVSYDPNGAEGDTKVAAIKTGETTNLMKNPYTRKGYTFLGWSKDSGAISASYSDQQQVTDLADTGKTVRLYAVWKKNDGSFSKTNIIHDDKMFTGDIEIEGQNGTGYDNAHTDSKYAKIDKNNDPGYFSDRYK